MNPLSIALRTCILPSVFLASLSIYINPASAQQRACVITDEDNTVCGRLTTQPKKPTSLPVQRKEVDKFVILLKSCVRSDTTVKCNFIVTNKGEERTLWLQADGSSMVDSNGKLYGASTVEIGGGNNQRLAPTISPGIDYVASMNFDKIPEQITRVPVLNLYIHNQNVQFRNVSFSN